MGLIAHFTLLDHFYSPEKAIETEILYIAQTTGIIVGYVPINLDRNGALTHLECSRVRSRAQLISERSRDIVSALKRSAIEVPLKGPRKGMTLS